MAIGNVDNKLAFDKAINRIMDYVFNDKPNPYALYDMLIELGEESSLDDSEYSDVM